MLISNTMFLDFRSFHQKVGIEKPSIDVKATHGVVNAELFSLPLLHSLWTPDAYSAFQLIEMPEDKKEKKVIFHGFG